jgi:ketosteroid isomerase-like protein
MADQKRTFMLRWFDEVWNKNNESIIDEMMHPEAEAFGLGPESIIGPDGFRPFYRAFTSAYSDINVTVDNTFVDGDHIISMCSVKAIHKETGKPVNFTGTSIALVKNGQIMSAWNHFDFLTMNLQTGKIKPEQLA